MEKEIKIQSEIENFDLVENFLEEISNNLSFPQKLYSKIYLAVLEACNNAIIHGNKNDPQKMVTIKFIEHPKYFSISINDEGNGFDYEQIKDPTSRENIKNESGRGIFIIRKMADNVEFLKQGKKIKIIFYK